MTKKLDTDKLVRVYIKMRDKKNEIKRQRDEEIADIEAQMDTIKEALLQYCEDNNVESSRTESGTFYRSTRSKYWTSDWDQFYQFVLEHEVPELLERRIAQNNLKTFLEENPDLSPKGLQADTEYTISVRKK